MNGRNIHENIRFCIPRNNKQIFLSIYVFVLCSSLDDYFKLDYQCNMLVPIEVMLVNDIMTFMKISKCILGIACNKIPHCCLETNMQFASMQITL